MNHIDIGDLRIHLTEPGHEMTNLEAAFCKALGLDPDLVIDQVQVIDAKTPTIGLKVIGLPITAKRMMEPTVRQFQLIEVTDTPNKTEATR